jgi:hypothetical protein
MISWVCLVYGQAHQHANAARLGTCHTFTFIMAGQTEFHQEHMLLLTCKHEGQATRLCSMRSTPAVTYSAMAFLYSTTFSVTMMGEPSMSCHFVLLTMLPNYGASQQQQTRVPGASNVLIRCL